mmetsp:Transcript_186/g.787  ORF Transcript_186/g.787 Transcript_186/m.787 type:complete len:363 (-) Transcript_186:124-1212(-)
MPSSALRIRRILVRLTCLAALSYDATADDPLCVYPSVCEPPARAFSRVAPVSPRQQWISDGGYCGSLSVQTSAMAFGAYFSQDAVRKAAEPGGGHGDEQNGYEILHTNILGALDKLHIEYEAFDWDNTPVPQSPYLLQFLKKQLSLGHPVVIFVMCKGDAHQCYDNPNATYDHIEAAFGIYSDHELSDARVFPDDVLVHTSGYAPDGEQNLGYFRSFDSLVDTVAMDGNCTDAIGVWKQNEMYPCFETNYSFAVAIKGLRVKSDLPVYVSVNSISEPDVTKGEQPVVLQAAVTVSGFQEGKTYKVYRYDDINWDVTKVEEVATVKASGDGGQLTLDEKFSSSSSVAYTCVEVQQSLAESVVE